MSNIQKVFWTIGAGITVFFGNTNSANAEKLPNLEGDRDTGKHFKSQPLKLKVNLAMASLPQSSAIDIQNPRLFLTASNWNFLPLPNKLSQLTPISPQNTPGSLPTLPAILRMDTSNNSADSLLLPTQPDEVTIDVEQPVTLEDSISIALTNNQEIEISRLNINLALEGLQEAKAAQYPSLSTSSSFDNRLAAGISAGAGAGAAGVGAGADASSSAGADASSSTGAGAGVPENISIDNSATNTFSSSLSLSYDVYDGGTRGASISSAEKQVRLDQLILEQTIEETSLQVSTNYYSLQSAEAQVQIEQAAVEDATQTLKDADLLERAGTGTEFEVLQAKVELAQAKQKLNIEQANLDVARRQLSNTLNIGQKVELQTKGEIKPAAKWERSLQESIVMAYENRAELEQFLVEREINAEERQIASAENRPQVALVATYDLSEELDDGSDVADGYSIGATVNWSLFDGGAAKARTRQAKTNIAIDEAEFANQRDAIRFEVEDAYYSLNANQKNINAATQAIKLSEESLRLARLRFQAGAGTQTDVIVAQTELTTARSNLLNAIVDYNQSFAELQRAISDLPNNDLANLR
jgi:outer membrane protein TolC